jgi:hypothetical protein
MSQFHSATKYDVSPKSYVCTNPRCANGLPHYRGFGKQTGRKCRLCGQPLIKINGEPRGTQHAR